MNTATQVCPSPSPAATLLRRSPLPDLRRLVIEETDEEVIITGTVGSYYLKQLAQETIRHSIGERRLRNRVVVLRETC